MPITAFKTVFVAFNLNAINFIVAMFLYRFSAKITFSFIVVPLKGA